jgi:predicted ester cyclase
VSPLKGRDSINDNALLTVYRNYLACLNERRWDELGTFVADRLSYNGNQFSLDDYRGMLQSDVRAIPDLQYRPELLLADDAIVSCRLLFQCTPQHTFLGFEPTGQQFTFAEHVFYRFEHRRIVEVWSLIDRDSIREQIRQSG